MSEDRSICWDCGCEVPFEQWKLQGGYCDDHLKTCNDCAYEKQCLDAHDEVCGDFEPQEVTLSIPVEGVVQWGTAGLDKLTQPDLSSWSDDE